MEMANIESLPNKTFTLQCLDLQKSEENKDIVCLLMKHATIQGFLLHYHL